MKTLVLLCIVLLTIVVVAGCSRKGRSSNTSETIVVGGIYAQEGKDGNFTVCKVLAVDDQAVHIRIYRNEFTSLPQNLDTSTLSLGKLGDPDGFGIGHAPIEKHGWLKSHVFLKEEPVREDELEGYKYYLEEMKK